MRTEDFDAVVARAIESLPSDFRSRLRNVVISVQEYAGPELLVETGEDELLGVYLGTPLTERHTNDTFLLPDQIFLFQGALEDACENDEELEDEIRVTLVHEVGHYFGLTEEEIEEALEAPRRAKKSREL
jgi:predicted Zn-dependent protease with MMP-like domain